VRHAQTKNVLKKSRLTHCYLICCYIYLINLKIHFKNKTYEKIKVSCLLLIVFIFSITSCNNESPAETSFNYLPSLTSSEKLSVEKINQINGSQLSAGRKEAYDFNQAISASYEGFEGMELAFIPSFEVQNEYIVYAFKAGKITDIVLKINSSQNEIKITSEAGIVYYHMNENVVEQIDINHNTGINASIGGKKKCDPAADFMKFQNAVQDQLVDKVGSWGAIAVDIGCSMWVVCRGAVVIAGVAYAASQCKS